jgi:hypothetical protein
MSHLNSRETDPLNILFEQILAVTRFKANLPKKDWVAGFFRRHPDLSVRTATLIKRGRAAVSAENINAFFDRLE